MSGGHWGYLQYRFHDHAGWIGSAIHLLGDLEQIVDWAVCNDTDPDEAAKECYDRLVEFFDNHCLTIARG